MPAKIDLVGHKYHRLKVLSENGKDNHNKIMYNCLCDCGNTLIVLGASLRSGNTKSCGIVGDLTMQPEMFDSEHEADEKRKSYEYKFNFGEVELKIEPVVEFVDEEKIS